MAEEINEPEDMFQSWDGKPIYAKKAERDVNGNSLELTIVDDVVTAIGGKSVGGGGEPVDAYTKAECDSQFMANKKLTGTSTIAGREYKTITIGNQVWLAENLDMKFDGLDVGSTEPPSIEELRANYYNNDEETYGAEGNKYGLLYNYPAVKYINDNRSTLIPGWHVPTEEEFFTLFRYIGETFNVGTTTTRAETAGLKLKSSSGWLQTPDGESGNGIDAFGMSVVPSGLNTGAFTNIGSVGNLWTITITFTPNIPNAQGVHFPTDEYAVIYPWYFGNEFGVRLVKDSDNSDDLWRKYDNKEFDAKHSDVAELAKKDINGNSLELTISGDTVTAIGGKSVGGGGSDIPTEGEVGQVLTKTQDGFGWEDAPVPDPELPSGGSPGQVLTKTQNGVAWSDPESASLPVATESDSVLYTAEPNGEASWVQMEKTVYGSIMTDEEGTPILDEEGKTIQDEDTATLWTGFNGTGFGAERAVGDENGNNIVATYATKADVETALGDIETLLAAL